MLRRVWQGRCRSNGQRCRENNWPPNRGRGRLSIPECVAIGATEWPRQFDRAPIVRNVRRLEDWPQADKLCRGRILRVLNPHDRSVLVPADRAEAVAAFGHVPREPEIDGVTAHAEPSSDLTSRQSSGQQQHHTASEDEPLRRGPRANPSFERGAVAAGKERWVNVDDTGQALLARFVRRSAHVSKLVVHVAQRHGSKGAVVLSIRAISRKEVSAPFVRFRGAVQSSLQVDFRPVGRSRPR